MSGSYTSTLVERVWHPFQLLTLTYRLRFAAAVVAKQRELHEISEALESIFSDVFGRLVQGEVDRLEQADQDLANRRKFVGVVFLSEYLPGGTVELPFLPYEVPTIVKALAEELARHCVSNQVST